MYQCLLFLLLLLNAAWRRACHGGGHAMEKGGHAMEEQQKPILLNQMEKVQYFNDKQMILQNKIH